MVSNRRLASPTMGRTTKFECILYIFEFLLTVLQRVTFLVEAESYSFLHILVLITE